MELGYIAWQARLGGLNFVIRRFNLEEAAAKPLIDIMVDRIRAFAAAARAEGKVFVLVLHPTKEEVYLEYILSRQLSFDSEIVDESIVKMKGVPAINIDSVKNSILKSLPEDILYLDLSDPMKREAISFPVNLYWQIDNHYTPAGHMFAAKHICEFLLREFQTEDMRSGSYQCTPSRNETQEVIALGQLKAFKGR